MRLLTDFQPMGPSPLARGKRRHMIWKEPLEGTIPARAGETLLQTYLPVLQRDHPRSRGGNRRPCNAVLVHPGPSPLARGKPSRARH